MEPQGGLPSHKTCPSRSSSKAGVAGLEIDFGGEPLRQLFVVAQCAWVFGGDDDGGEGFGDEEDWLRQERAVDEEGGEEDGDEDTDEEKEDVRDDHGFAGGEEGGSGFVLLVRINFGAPVAWYCPEDAIVAVKDVRKMY